MKAVVSTVRLNEPIPREEFETIDVERVRTLAGFHSMQVIQLSDTELVLVIVADDEAALDRMRDEFGNEWMRAHVVPRAAGPADRRVGEVVVAV